VNEAPPDVTAILDANLRAELAKTGASPEAVEATVAELRLLTERFAQRLRDGA
jgi:hypothetical protein